MHDLKNITFDPILGLEKIRKDLLGLSKSAFYGPKGIVHEFPIVEISAKRRGVRYSALQDVLERRTNAPRNALGTKPVSNVKPDAS